ncbi:MAG: multiheme c-type cytochrome [Thermodesulfobacteriota bacterium]
MQPLKLLGVVFLLIAASSFPALGGDEALSRHWQRPIDHSPAFSAKELLPESCGSCHKDKLKDWSGSMHSKSVGPALLFQLDPMADPETAAACYFCHAPFSQQNEVFRKRSASGNGAFIKNRRFDEKLKSTGVSCVVCHVRGPGISGPPAHEQTTLKSAKTDAHEIVQEHFFEEAAFCAACHQLEQGYRINGNLLVNTYTEWKDSAFGRAGIPCQNCHMPGERHLFKGIHDAKMTKSGIEVKVSALKDKGGKMARLTVTNSTTGHYFPTYATPLIIINAFLEDNAGRPLKGTSKEAFIGRKLALDLSKEFFDTRIAPQKSFVFDYPLKVTKKARRLVFEATVYPDEFYNRFYKFFLTQKTTGKRMRQIEEAYKTSSNSSYELFRKELPLKNVVFVRPESPESQ